MNTITKETTKEDLLEEYKTYPLTGADNIVEEKPFYIHRLAPIFYEVPMKSRVLDVGCNDGTMMKLLKDKRECKVYGVDISEVALDVAKNKGLNVQFADAHILPFKDKYFDVVILSEVLSHVKNPDEVLSEIRRVLKKDGSLLGSCPHANLMRHVWEDKRKIRQYYETNELVEVLNKSFKKTYIKTLKGGQFSMGFAEGFMADMDAEILFKSGGKDTKDWEEALLDKSILRVWFGPTQGPGTTYYRMRGFIDKMRSDRVEIGYDPYENSDDQGPSAWQQKIMRSQAFPDRARSMVALNHLEQVLKASDLSVWQITPYKDVLAFMRCAKDVLKKPIVTELDDWLYDLPAYNIASNPYQPNSEAMWVAYEQMNMSDAFIVSTKFIQEMCKEMFPHVPCYVVKNSIDFNVWDKVEAVPLPNERFKKEGGIRIGFTGCGNHDEDIALIKEPILALLDEYPNLEFIYPAVGLPSWKDVTHPRVLKWNTWVPIDQFPGHAKGWDMDIGVAPLRDNTFNRAKSNLRWLEYSALGIPSVMSDVRPFQECIKEGKTGFLVNSKRQWYEKLKQLIDSESMRKNVGRFAYDEVKQNYSMDNVARSYTSILKEIKRGALK